MNTVGNPHAIIWLSAQALMGVFDTLIVNGSWQNARTTAKGISIPSFELVTPCHKATLNQKGISMSWTVLALLGAAIISIANISDKTVIHRYAKHPLTLPLLIGMGGTISGITFFIIAGIPDGATIETSGAALVSGAFWGFSGVIMTRVLFNQEVSRTIPVTQSSPIFAALLSMVFLDEDISRLQWGGIVFTVLGSILLSLRIRNVGTIFLDRSFYFLMLSALTFAIGNIIGKYVLDELPILSTHGLRMLGLGGAFLIFSLRTASWTEVKEFYLSRSPALFFVGINEFITANVALLLLLSALSKGPAALVIALMGTRSLFVFIYSTVITLIWQGSLGEQLSPKTVLVKVISVAIIVAGIAAIAI